MGDIRLNLHDYQKSLIKNTREIISETCQNMKSPMLRTMREFAEQEIIIPDGIYQGRRFRCDRQPFTKLFFDAVDSGQWNRFVATGPTQSGKTLTCFIIPCLYHLFELKESVILGIPDMAMARDKWRQDLEPAIQASRYAKYIPDQGSGSKGGMTDSIRFTNGTTLRFMSGGGGDKQRAGFTSRVVIITETDGMDSKGGASREADKITQLEARTNSYGEMKRIYMECTVSIEKGRTWQEYQNGTRSRILQKCPDCGNYVHLERKHLVGWDEAESEMQAEDLARWVCPSCGVCWEEEQRKSAAKHAILLHQGQEIDEGQVVGELPPTRTLGFRWSAQDNLFRDAASVGKEEWRSKFRATSEETETALRQFTWTLPIIPKEIELSSVSPDAVMNSMTDIPRGVIPEDSQFLVGAMDIGKYVTHWGFVAIRPGFGMHIIDYGKLIVSSEAQGFEKALWSTLTEFVDVCEAGYIKRSEPDDPIKPDLVLIDTGYEPDVIYRFLHSAQKKYLKAYLGWGSTQKVAGQQGKYTNPKTKGNTKFIGDSCHINVDKITKRVRVDGDADRWKSFLHQRIQASNQGERNQFSLFHLPRRIDHLEFAQHMTAEREIEVFVQGSGLMKKWEALSQKNHYFDVGYMCAVAGYIAGARLQFDDERTPTRPKTPPKQTEPPQAYRGHRIRTKY